MIYHMHVKSLLNFEDKIYIWNWLLMFNYKLLNHSVDKNKIRREYSNENEWDGKFDSVKKNFEY